MQAAPILLDGLSKLEYRGYDSAGIAVRDGEQRDRSHCKAKGRLKELLEKTNGGKAIPGGTVVSVIQDGQHMENRLRRMHIRIVSDDGNVVMLFIMELLRTIRN